jgi:hypothetical protein
LLTVSAICTGDRAPTMAEAILGPPQHPSDGEAGARAPLDSIPSRFRLSSASFSMLAAVSRLLTRPCAGSSQTQTALGGDHDIARAADRPTSVSACPRP